MNTYDIIAMKNSMNKSDSSTDPLDEADIAEFHEKYKNPPGSLGEFIEEIEKNFERRHEGERYRLVGALGLAQIMAGRFIIGPTGSKCSTGIFLVARSGAGKQAPVNFIKQYADALMISDRLCTTTATSLKQIQTSMIEGDGSLLYVVNDDKQHIDAWNDPRSAYLGGTAPWYRGLSDEGGWVPTRTIIRDIEEQLAKAMNPKTIVSVAMAEGWIVPRVGGAQDGMIDYKKLSQMDHSIGRNLKKVMSEHELCTRDGGIENARFIPLITVTPVQGLDAVRSWQKDGGMGRTLFILGHGDDEDMPVLKKDQPTGSVNRKIVNEWKHRILRSITRVEFESEKVNDKRYELVCHLEKCLGNVEGVIGDVVPRAGQMIVDLASICAFTDLSSRNGMTPVLKEEHLEWAYMTVINHLRSLRDYVEGDVAFSGLEEDEWENIIAKMKKIMEGKKFIAKPYTSVLKSALCRGRIETIIKAANSNHLQVTPERFISEILVSITENRHSPIDIEASAISGGSRIVFRDEGSWNGLRMNASVRNIISSAVKRMKFMRNIK